MDSFKNIIPLTSASVSASVPSDGPRQNKPKSICKKALVNKLNYINFSDRTILINFKHAKYATTLSLAAKPLPCAGERLECVWADTPEPGILRAHTFLNLFISDGHKCLLVTPESASIYEQGISMLLPDACQEIRARK